MVRAPGLEGAHADDFLSLAEPISGILRHIGAVYGPQLRHVASGNGMTARQAGPACQKLAPFGPETKRCGR